MRIELHEVSKRYSLEWILRNASYTFEPGNIYAVTGRNGSGKSTLLSMIAGFLSPSKGEIRYYSARGAVSRNDIYRYMAYAAPYISPPKQLTVAEVIALTNNFRKWRPLPGSSAFSDYIGMSSLMDSRIENLSSGQAQRLSLSLAILSDTPVLLLDEPGSYLDLESREWFQGLIRDHQDQRCVIIASNDPSDYREAQETIDMANFL